MADFQISDEDCGDERCELSLSTYGNRLSIDIERGKVDTIRYIRYDTIPHRATSLHLKKRDSDPHN